MMAGIVPLFTTVSTIPVWQVHMSHLFIVVVMASCDTSSAPVVHSHIIEFGIALLVFAPG